MGSLQTILQTENYIDKLLLDFCADKGHEIDIRLLKKGTVAENRVFQSVNKIESDNNVWTDNVQNMNFM